MLRLILVSQSPERRKILHERGYLFDTTSVSLSEKLNKTIGLDAAIEDISRQKACAFLKTLKKEEKKSLLVLTADTLVVAGDRVLAKPRDEKEALSHLNTLSATRHSVKTALTFYEGDTDEISSYLDTTFVTFKNLTEEEKQDFLKTKDYVGKAGGYGIQGPASNFVLKTEGSLTNVRGFPLELFEKIVQKKGWNLQKRIDHEL